MRFQIYEFTAQDFEANSDYTFEAYLLPTGEVLVPASTTNDEFYASLGAVDAHGNAYVTKHENTGRTVNFTEEELQAAISGSAKEFGKDAIPETLRQWIVDEN